MTEFIKASDIAAAPAKEDPKSRAEAELYISYKTLVATGRCVQKRGVVLILVYAGKRGKDQRAVAIRHTTGKAAKRSQTLIRRDLRGVGDDEGYNRVIDAVLDVIQEAADERASGKAQMALEHMRGSSGPPPVQDSVGSAEAESGTPAVGTSGVVSGVHSDPADVLEEVQTDRSNAVGVLVDRGVSVDGGDERERSHLIVVGGYNFHHVHDCFNSRDDKAGRRCRYNWAAHIIIGDGSTCPCIPHIDDSNIKFGRKEVFVVHKGRD